MGADIPEGSAAQPSPDNKNARRQIKDEGALPVIPSGCTATKKARCPKRFYRQRHKIENFFCHAKDRRRIATTRFLAAVLMIGTLYRIKLCADPKSGHNVMYP